jgi:hypothetical protein
VRVISLIGCARSTPLPHPFDAMDRMRVRRHCEGAETLRDLGANLACPRSESLAWDVGEGYIATLAAFACRGWV